MSFNFSHPYFYRTALFVVLAELFSFFGFLYPFFGSVVFFVIVGLFLCIALTRLDWALLILFAELFIGSKGYLFSFSFGGTLVSIRIALWLLVVAVWAFSSGRAWIRNAHGQWESVCMFFRSSVGRMYALLFFFLLWALLRAWFLENHFQDIFFDFNAWLFFLLLVPILTSFQSRIMFHRFFLVLLASTMVNAAKVLTLFFLFTHDAFSTHISLVYRWVRVTGIGEITALSGGMFRIFFQSQLYTLFAIFFVLLLLQYTPWRRWQRWALLVLGGAYGASIWISFSRSFWVSGILGLCLLGGACVFFSSSRRSAAWRLLGHGMLISFFSVFFIFGILRIPFFHLTGAPILLDAFEERTTRADDVAVSSRWSLLPNLWERIRESLFLGEGFGATVTYESSDPRIVQQTARGNHLYTTYAFEWGYLDLWLKLGAFGLGAYLLLLFFLGKRLSVFMVRSSLPDDRLPAFFFLIALFVVGITHVFSPYLNHPLGITFLLMISAYVFTQERARALPSSD